MKYLDLVVFSVIVAIGTIVAAPDAARATATPVSEIVFAWPVNSGTVTTPIASNVSGFPWLITATETCGWTVVGTDADGNAVTNTYNISNGKIQIAAGNPTNAVFSGKIGGVPFTFTANITAGTESYSHQGLQSWFSWEANVPNIGSLSNLFSPAGPFTDAVKMPFMSCSDKIISGGSSLDAVPIPASLVLFASALLGLLGVRKRLSKGE